MLYAKMDKIAQSENKCSSVNLTLINQDFSRATHVQNDTNNYMHIHMIKHPPHLVAEHQATTMITTPEIKLFT